MRSKAILLNGTITVLLSLGIFPIFGQRTGFSQERIGAVALIAELGCAYCHLDLASKGTLKDQTPDLSSAGWRYHPAYLFDFLRNPVKVRQHLGHARMPDFYLSEKEALALVAFLEAQRTISGTWPELPASIQRQLSDKPRRLSTTELEMVKTESLLCLSCHTLNGQGGNRAVELASVGFRLQPDWVKRF